MKAVISASLSGIARPNEMARCGRHSVCVNQGETLISSVMKTLRRVTWVVLFFSLSLLVGTSYGATVALMGPQPFLRTTGNPNVYSATFIGRPGAGTLLIQNGDSSGQVQVIALIVVNGRQVVRGSNFDAPYTSKAVPVKLARDNSISIELRGAPNNYLTVTVLEEINCTALDQCHVAGTWDWSLGACSNPEAPNGTTCNDGNACTQTDACQSGLCVGTNPVVCQAMDQCHTAGVCDPSSGMCSNLAVPNGITCNDGNACTRTDACQSGLCVGTNPVFCKARGQCHLWGVCDPANGVCSDPVKPDGTICTDGNLCTQNDSFQTGVCVGSAIPCDDDNFCTADSCDPAKGLRPHRSENSHHDITNADALLSHLPGWTGQPLSRPRPDMRPVEW